MNEIIITRFEFYQRLLIESPAISRFIVLKQRIASNDGHVRIRATLTDGGLLEFSEYIVLDDDLPIERAYSFHWQDAQQRLVQRWDNAKHYPHLPHAPHHIHQVDGTVKGKPEPPTLPIILSEIEQRIV